MQSFIAFMEKHFLPVAAKIGNQRHLVAIRDAFAYTMPLMILGAFATLINNLPIPGYIDLMNSIFSEKLKDGTFIWTKLGELMEWDFCRIRGYDRVFSRVQLGEVL